MSGKRRHALSPKTWTASGFLSHQELSEAVELDAVIVCTPPSSHPEICLHFLSRKIPVLCEKPLAPDPGRGTHDSRGGQEERGNLYNGLQVPLR